MNSLLNDTHRPEAPLDPERVDDLPNSTEMFDLSSPSPANDGSADDGDSDLCSASMDSAISHISFKSDESKVLPINFKAGYSSAEFDFDPPTPTNDGSADDEEELNSEFDFDPPTPTNDGSADDGDTDQSITSVESTVSSKSDEPERPITVLSGGDSRLRVSLKRKAPSEYVSVQSCGSPGYISARADFTSPEVDEDEKK